MEIWILNLIDTREKNRNTPEKFRQCKDMGILAIGWAKENPLTFYKDGDLKAYKAAVKGLSSIEPDDLIWVRDAANKEYYICKVCSTLEKAPPNFWHKDIGAYRKAEWYGPVSQNALPPPLTVRRLVSKATIRRVLKPEVIRATQEFFNSILTHKKVIWRDSE